MSSSGYRAIDVEGLTKQYRLPQASEPVVSNSSIVVELLNAVRRRRTKNNSPSTFNALKDVSFQIEVGDRLGIVGRNGAGKSTLLKILSRVTFPTQGRVTTRGRVASLLEVGTGFHPELSGRENVYLNGALLGMKRHQIRERFNSIVQFAEIEKFIDLPVKRYSSGMYVRLAFAVAAHLDPDILILDEVLAVGDTRFQKKCLGRIGELEKSGKTILFVSHSLTTVLSFCSKGLYLKDGQVVEIGPSQDVVNRYLAEGTSMGVDKNYEHFKHSYSSDAATLVRARLIDSGGQTKVLPNIQDRIGIEVTFDVHRVQGTMIPNIHLFDAFGAYVCVLSEDHLKVNNAIRKPGRYRSTVWIPANTLNDCRYRVGVALTTLDPVDLHFFDSEAIEFEMTDDLNARAYGGVIPGVVRPQLDWDIERMSDRFVQPEAPCV